MNTLCVFGPDCQHGVSYSELLQLPPALTITTAPTCVVYTYLTLGADMCAQKQQRNINIGHSAINRMHTFDEHMGKHLLEAALHSATHTATVKALQQTCL